MMNGFNQYICDICKQPCQIQSRARKFGKGTRWQVCSCPPKDIQLCYAVSIQGKIKAIMYNIKMDKFHWQLVISYQDNETVLNKLSNLYSKEEVIKIPSCAQGITPKNVLEKIKLFLLLS